ncbi:GMC oxidoreductase-domain-containing protein [Mycena sanguinolenta]|nr:GMC oxidoreductase-domain-containing protein [Mycena sanguinolenta]
MSASQIAITLSSTVILWGRDSVDVPRGHAAEYDVLQTPGSPGWNWEGLVEYFGSSFKTFQSETFSPTAEEMSKLQVEFNTTAHGKSGPLQRKLPKWISSVQPPFIEAMKSLNVPYNPDGTSGNNVDMWISNHSIDSQGTRSSPASAYYSPNQSKSNLTVVTGAYATRILFSSATDASGNLVASGVEYHKDGGLRTVSARREVLCAGTLKTPQLLELSGVSSALLGYSKIIDFTPNRHRRQGRSRGLRCGGEIGILGSWEESCWKIGRKWQSA